MHFPPALCKFIKSLIDYNREHYGYNNSYYSFKTLRVVIRLTSRNILRPAIGILVSLLQNFFLWFKFIYESPKYIMQDNEIDLVSHFNKLV